MPRICRCRAMNRCRITCRAACSVPSSRPQSRPSKRQSRKSQASSLGVTWQPATRSKSRHRTGIATCWQTCTSSMQPEVRDAVDTAVAAQRSWSAWSFQDRAAVFLKAAELVGGSVAESPQCGNHGWPEQDGRAGRDRCCVRTCGFSAFQRSLCRTAVDRATGVEPWCLEPRGLPAARRLRLCNLAVQLHGHWRQPRDSAGTHGEYRRVETGGVCRPEQLAHHAAAASGGIAPWRHQLCAG